MKDKLLNKVIENTKNGILVVEKDTIIHSNKKARAIFGHDLSLEVIGYSLSQKHLYKNGSYYSLDLILEEDSIKVYEIADMTGEYEQDRLRCYFDLILDKVSHGIITTDKEGRIVEYNKASEEFEGLHKKDVIGKKSNDIYDVSPEESQLLNVIKSGRQILDIDGRFQTMKGRDVVLVSNYYPVYKDEELIGACAISENVTRIQNLLEKTMELQNKLSKGKVNDALSYGFDDIIGESHSLQKALNEGIQASKSDSPVLVIGETGTGKEMFVQSIHRNSRRSENPFTPINCAAIPENLLESILFGTEKGSFTGAEKKTGLIEQAKDGTLYLDELNSMPLNLQAKLLRVIQEKVFRRVGGESLKKVNCRFIASINETPEYCIENNKLRSDLFYRLAVNTIEIPSLMARKDDIEILSNHFIKKFNEKHLCNIKGISEELKEIFSNYDWPGNVRELQYVLEGAMSMDKSIEEIKIEHLPNYFFKKFSNIKAGMIFASYSSMHLNDILEKTEKEIVKNHLAKHKGNVTNAAKELGISRQNLHYRIRKHKLHDLINKDFRK